MGFVILAINLFFNTPIFFVSHPDKSRMTLLKIVALLVIGTLLECTPGCGFKAWIHKTRAPTPCLGEGQECTPGSDTCCGAHMVCRLHIYYWGKEGYECQDMIPGSQGFSGGKRMDNVDHFGMRAFF